MWKDTGFSQITAKWWLLFALTAGPPDSWAATIAAASATEPPVRQEAGKAQTEVSQHGITWRFAAPARVGRFITGDWWVAGPVTITEITPAPAAASNGSVVDPPAGKRQGYDERIAGYDASLRAALPLAAPAGTVVGQHGERRAGRPADAGNRPGPILPRAAADGSRPDLPAPSRRPPMPFARPMSASEKLWFTASQLRRERLPRLRGPEKLPDVKLYERYLERVWLDHMHEWPNRMMHPLENMPDYGREITNIVSTVSLLLCLDDPEQPA